MPRSHQIHIPKYPSDITAIKIYANYAPFFLFNIYNPPATNTTINSLASYFKIHPLNGPLLILGDFNKHHLMWAGLTPLGTLHPARA